jgi:hypothetical protein
MKCKQARLAFRSLPPAVLGAYKKRLRPGAINNRGEVIAYGSGPLENTNGGVFYYTADGAYTHVMTSSPGYGYGEARGINAFSLNMSKRPHSRSRPRRPLRLHWLQETCVGPLLNPPVF